MPWSTQNGGGRPGGGRGPWGSGTGGSGGGQPPDLEELLKRSQDRLRKALPGGLGTGGIVAALLVVGVVWLLSGIYVVEPDEQGVVLRFGAVTKQTNPGINYHLPWPIETAFTPKVTRENQVNIGYISSTAGGTQGVAQRDVPEESLMLTGDENIVDIDFTVFWIIRDASDHWVRDGAQIQGAGTRDDNDNFFIEIPIPDSVVTDEVLLVADVGLPQTITKVEAVTRVDDDFSSNGSDYLTNAGLRIQLTRTLNASVNLVYEHQENESGGLSFTKDQRLVDGNLRWTPVPYLSPALGFSENRQDETGEETQIDRSYSLTLLTVPLPTVNVVFGVTRYERYDGELQTFSSDRYSITSKAQIYPDLSADLSLNWLNSDAWDSDRLLTDSSSFSTRLNLNAQLTRALTADLATTYRTNQSEIESPDISAAPGRTSSEGADAKFGLQYRPSALLALSGAYTTFFAGEPRSDEITMSMTLALLRTDKARFNLLASRSQAETSSNSVSLNGSWDISRKLSLLTQANYAYGDTYFYSILTTLSLRL